MHVIINSRNYRNFEVISCEYLRRLVNKNMSFFKVLLNVSFHFAKICFRCPTININNCKEKILCRNHHFLKIFLKMLSAPRDIRSFSFLLILPNFMQSIIHVPEFIFEFSDNLLSFFVSSLLMFFHCQKYEICEFGSFMSR